MSVTRTPVIATESIRESATRWRVAAWVLTAIAGVLLVPVALDAASVLDFVWNGEHCRTASCVVADGSGVDPNVDIGVAREALTAAGVAAPMAYLAYLLPSLLLATLLLVFGAVAASETGLGRSTVWRSWLVRTQVVLGAVLAATLVLVGRHWASIDWFSYVVD